MYTKIDIDFDVYKELTIRRQSPEISENDVLRDLLGLGKTSSITEQNSNSANGADWVAKGVSLPHGTTLRTNFSGRIYSAEISNGEILYEGKTFRSLSAAAEAITTYPTNGWTFWECRTPGKSDWTTLKNLRKNN